MKYLAEKAEVLIIKLKIKTSQKVKADDGYAADRLRSITEQLEDLLEEFKFSSTNPTLHPERDRKALVDFMKEIQEEVIGGKKMKFTNELIIRTQKDEETRIDTLKIKDQQPTLEWTYDGFGDLQEFTIFSNGFHYERIDVLCQALQFNIKKMAQLIGAASDDIPTNEVIITKEILENMAERVVWELE